MNNMYKRNSKNVIKHDDYHNEVAGTEWKMKPPASRGERGYLLSVKISHKNHLIRITPQNSRITHSTQESLHKTHSTTHSRNCHELIRNLSTNCTLPAAREGKRGLPSTKLLAHKSSLGFSPTLSCSRRVFSTLTCSRRSLLFSHLGNTKG